MINTLTTSPAYVPCAAERAIDWLSVVDDFKINKQRNIFPRWTVLMAILAVMAI